MKTCANPEVTVPFTPNMNIPLPVNQAIEGRWIEKNTAILVVHGIGHQNPLETIDQFGRTLAETFHDEGGLELNITHGLAAKKRSNNHDQWFDNYIRIQRKEDDGTSGPHLDIYEYYWANKTEDRADLTDIDRWVKNVSKGARKFYSDNKNLGLRYRDESMFFKNGKFKGLKYTFFVYFVCAFLPALSYFTELVLKLLSQLPIVGIPFRWLFNAFSHSKLKMIANVIGDIIIYNTVDQKCKFYAIRQEILTGAVKALRYLVEGDEQGSLHYDRVMVVGHSLGSQIAYDAINRLVHDVNGGEVNGYDKAGRTIAGKKLDEVICGFVTFGSPLDKIAFFLREHVNSEAYIRRQMLHNFHSFKQREWDLHKRKYPFLLAPLFERLLEDVAWRNYFDKRDYVSGGLDYYHNLINLDCEFQSSWYSFTHSRYWEHKPMYEDIIRNMLL